MESLFKRRSIDAEFFLEHKNKIESVVFKTREIAESEINSLAEIEANNIFLGRHMSSSDIVSSFRIECNEGGTEELEDEDGGRRFFFFYQSEAEQSSIKKRHDDFDSYHKKRREELIDALSNSKTNFSDFNDLINKYKKNKIIEMKKRKEAWRISKNKKPFKGKHGVESYRARKKTVQFLKGRLKPIYSSKTFSKKIPPLPTSYHKDFENHKEKKPVIPEQITDDIKGQLKESWKEIQKSLSNISKSVLDSLIGFIAKNQKNPVPRVYRFFKIYSQLCKDLMKTTFDTIDHVVEAIDDPDSSLEEIRDNHFESVDRVMQQFNEKMVDIPCESGVIKELNNIRNEISNCILVAWDLTLTYCRSKKDGEGVFSPIVLSNEYKNHTLKIFAFPFSETNSKSKFPETKGE